MKKSKTEPIKISILIGVAGLLFTGCGGNSTDPDPEDEFTIQTVSTQSYGDVLTDGETNVLYFFAPDVKGESKCEGNCIANWPVFDAGEIMPGEGLEASDFGSVSRTDGSSQTTYKGWPLYYYSNDNQPGDIYGDGAANGLWYVAKPDNSLMIANEQLVGADGVNYIIDENGEYVTGDGNTTYFTDAEGRTLYAFANDQANTNNCTGGCVDAWPVFHTDIEALPSGLDSEDFGEFTAHGDRQQLTYKGWPVYYFVQDAERGDNKGVSIGLDMETGEATWPIINNDTPNAPEQ